MRLLIVEDERDLADVLRRAFEEEGYVCDVALDGIEGLYKAECWDYDAILLDLMLPGISGRELLAKLRAQKPTPVLAVTARDTLEDKLETLDGGADDYLTKPFELEELIARVRALVRRAAGIATARLEIGDVVVDTVSRTIRRSDETIAFSPREYALVEFLALHRGELVTRTRLYEHLYGEDDDTLSNVIDVFVSRVRKKLGRDFIRTRRGEGYLIDGP